MFAPVFGAIAHQFSDLRDPAGKDRLWGIESTLVSQVGYTSVVLFAFFHFLCNSANQIRQRDFFFLFSQLVSFRGPFWRAR